MSWNSTRYSIYAPIYDVLAFPLRRARRRAVALAHIPDGASILVVGVGTGLDLPLLPPSCTVTAVDLSGTMLNLAKRRAAKYRRMVDFQRMDVQDLAFPDERFDVVVVHLIAAVVPDGRACVAEACRALKPGGRLSLFDKFRSDQAEQVSPIRKILGVPSRFFFSDINRRAGDLVEGLPLEPIGNRPVAFGGLFHAWVFRKTSG